MVSGPHASAIAGSHNNVSSEYSVAVGGYNNVALSLSSTSVVLVGGAHNMWSLDLMPLPLLDPIIMFQVSIRLLWVDITM